MTTHLSGVFPSAAFYLTGALILVFSMMNVVNIGWEASGGAGVAGVAAVYASLFGALAEKLWRERLAVAGGALFAVAVAPVPLLVYGAQRAAGGWPRRDGAAVDFAAWRVWSRARTGGIWAGATEKRSTRAVRVTRRISARSSDELSR